MKGTQDVHSIKFINIGDVKKMLRKDLSYFFCFCLDGNYNMCVNLA